MPIPDNLTAVWEALYNEVVAVHARWINYRELFDTSGERTKKLYATAFVFFYILQTTLLDDIQLTLGRLGDPAVTLGRENATLRTLLNEVKAVGHSHLINDLQERLSTFQTACEPIRMRRNRLIGHYDLRALLERYAFASGVSATPPQLSGANTEEIETALTALASFMNAIENYFTGFVTAYHMFRREDGAASLIEMIQCGMRYRDLLLSGALPRESLSRVEGYQW